jgi:hypothetical protein
MTTRALALFLVITILGAGRPTAAENPVGIRPALMLAPSVAHPQTMVALTQVYRYSFLAPGGWTLDLDQAGKVVRITAPEQRGLIRIHFADDSREKFQPADFANWRESLLQEHAGATDGGAFTLNTLSTTAPGADLSWVHADKLRMEGRFTRIPVGTGYLELSLVTSPKHFEECLPPFMQLVGSLQFGNLGDALEIRAMGQE